MAGWCADGAISADHLQLIDDIEQQGGGRIPASDTRSFIGCYGSNIAGNSNWAISTTLASDDTIKICMDSSGRTRIGLGTTIPAGSSQCSGGTIQ